MSDPHLLPQQDDPNHSPALLRPLPKRGHGVRRLNNVPVVIAAGGICLVMAAIGYTYRARLQSLVAAQHTSDTKAESAGNAAVLNGAPQTGEIKAAAPRPTTSPATAQPALTPPPAPTTRAQTGPSEIHQGQAGQADDVEEQARKQAWQNYYQQVAALQQQRQQEAISALKADTAPNGTTGAGANLQQVSGAAADGGALPLQVAQAQGTVPQSGTATPAVYPAGHAYAAGPGGFGAGAGYPAALPPAGPDSTGAFEKQAFTSQTGNLGQEDTLAATVRDPISPYVVTAGDVIPCVAQSGENSDAPGQFVGRVSRNIYDSATGRYLLIPQNSKVIGSYDNVVTGGQSRIPTVITRVIFPDSSSVPLGAMPAADQAGFAGLHDRVDRHLWEKFGNALILSLGSAGIQLSQGTGQTTYGYNAQQIGAAAIGQQLGQLGQEYARSGLAIPNTIQIRNGYNFVVQVTKDIVLRPYVDRMSATVVRPTAFGDPGQ